MGRREQVLKAACDKLKSEGIAAMYFAGDVRKYEACERAVEAVLGAYGRLDICTFRTKDVNEQCGRLS